ncbi:MAG: cell division protein FtsQ/DivIB [Alphaproteobacteria bacterium]
MRSVKKGAQKAPVRRRVKRGGGFRLRFLSPLREMSSGTRNVLLFSLYGLFFLLVPGIAWYSGYPQQCWVRTVDAAIDLTKRAGFSVKEVLVEGRHAADSQSILDAIQLKQGQAVFSVSPQEIQQRLETHPWVRQAAVRRQLPGTLYIQLTERRAVAIWQHQKKFYVVDEQGVVIAPMSRQQPDLPVIIGKDAPLYAPQMLKILDSFQSIKQRTTSLIYVSGRRWNLLLNQTIEVRLPEKECEKALVRLSHLLEQKNLGPNEVYMIDLRMPDRIIIRPSAAASVRLKVKGKEA